MSGKPSYGELEQQVQEFKRKLEQCETALAAVKRDCSALQPDVRAVFAMDIPEPTQAENALRVSELKLRATLDATPFPIAVVDLKDDNIYFWSRSATALFGHTAPTSSEWYQMAYPDPDYRREVVERWKPFLEIARKSGQPVNAGEYRITCRDGSVRICELYATFIPDNLIVTFNDITGRKQAEEALRKSEALFNLITRHTSALVSINDADGDYIYASPSHEHLGYKPEDLIGKSGFTMIEEEDVGTLLEHLEQATAGKLSKAYLDYKIKDKKGRIHLYRGAFDAVFNPDGSLERIICVGEDITELRKAQAEKMDALVLATESKKLALVGQIAGRIAHDFNNILGVIMGNTELAILDCPHDPTRKSLELIFEQTIRGKNLTKNLVAFAKDQEPKQEFFSIHEKIELVINLLKKDLEGIQVIREYGEGLPELLADPGMIEHAIVNLLQNAIHATSLVQKPKIVIRTYPHGGQLFIEIEDNGCGIPTEFLGEIFEPAFTLKGSKDKHGMYKPGIHGTGYGMSNVKKYIERHRGNISIQSEFQKGVKVTITLPIVKKELTNEEIAEVKKTHVVFDKYILLVEDEQGISDVQYRMLTHEPFHHKVDIANNGQVAMDLLNRNEYDLISLDYILPGELNGMDIYHHIREKNKTVPVLFISGNLEFLESIKDLMQQDPHIDHLSKPCTNIDYVNRINMLFGRVR